MITDKEFTIRNIGGPYHFEIRAKSFSELEIKANEFFNKNNIPIRAYLVNDNNKEEKDDL